MSINSNIDPNAWLMSGGTPSAKFEHIGASVTGRIVDAPQVRPQTDPNTGMPKLFANGDPMMQLVVRLQTDQRDQEITNDDGIRAVYIKGQSQQAVREAVRKSGAPGLEVGGTLTMTYVGDGERTKAAFSPPKHYSATYVPASANKANAFLGTTPQAAPQQPTGQVTDAATAAILAGLTPDQKAALGIPA